MNECEKMVPCFVKSTLFSLIRMNKAFMGLWIVCSVVTTTCFAQEPLSSTVQPIEVNEQRLLQSLMAIQNNDIDQALKLVTELVDSAPNYKLAQLLKADLFALKSGQSLVAHSFATDYPKTLAKLHKEAAVRWAFANQSSKSAHTLLEVLQSVVLKSAGQTPVILVDLQQRRLHLFRQQNHHWIEIANFYSSIGARGTGKQKEGDRRTPVGIYQVVDYISDRRLPDFYGSGALPINYPNPWDQYLGRTGSGIWLHGVPKDTYVRDPNASRGCVVLSNDDMSDLIKKYKIPLRTPVILWDAKKAFKSDGVMSGQSFLAQLKPRIEASNMDWQSTAVYRYPGESSVFYVTHPQTQIAEKAAKQTTELRHQFWRWSQANQSWQKVLDKTLPTHLPYRFPWEK